MERESDRVTEILRTTINRLDISEPVGISRIFCSLLRYYTTNPLSVPEQASLSLNLLSQGSLDILLDLLTVSSIELSSYVDILTLIVTILTTPKRSIGMQNEYGVSKQKLSKIVDCLFTAIHNALNAQLSETVPNGDALYSVISSCLSHLERLASKFDSVCMTVLNSASLLHLIVKDDGFVTYPILSCLFSILKLSVGKLSVLKSSCVYSLLDELILKLGQRDREIALKSVLSMHILILNCSQLQTDRLSRRYKGVAPVIKKWLGNDFDEILQEILVKLDPSLLFGDERHRSARVIQSHFRGYSERNRILRIHRVVVRVQSRVRFNLWVGGFNKRCERAKLLKKLLLSDQVRDESIRRQIETFKIIENLPAIEVQGYFEEQQHKSAQYIQNWWRCIRSKRIACGLGNGKRIEKSAICIQRAYRKHLLRKLPKLSYNPIEITPEMKHEIEAQIEKWRENRKSKRTHTDKELDRLHNEVSALLDNYPSKSLSRQQKLQECEDKLMNIGRMSHLLMSPPSLSEVTTEHLEIYSVPKSQSDIRNKARQAHKQELKRLRVPWWKVLCEIDD